VLSDLAATDAVAFAEIIKAAQTALAAKPAATLAKA
jgi:ribosomal protein L20